MERRLVLFTRPAMMIGTSLGHAVANLIPVNALRTETNTTLTIHITSSSSLQETSSTT